jgi:activator of 2-hydroxyglutaryl-CoA dehydratase
VAGGSSHRRLVGMVNRGENPGCLDLDAVSCCLFFMESSKTKDKEAPGIHPEEILVVLTSLANNAWEQIIRVASGQGFT